MSDWIIDKMMCLGCNKDKPGSDFESPNSPLCKRCKSARVVSTSSKGQFASNGSWIGDLIDGIFDIFD